MNLTDAKIAELEPPPEFIEWIKSKDCERLCGEYYRAAGRGESLRIVDFMLATWLAATTAQARQIADLEQSLRVEQQHSKFQQGLRERECVPGVGNDKPNLGLCIYCGFETDLGAPDVAEQLIAHHDVCERSPLQAARRDSAELETALRDLLDFARRRIATGHIPPQGQRAIDLLARIDAARAVHSPGTDR